MTETDVVEIDTYEPDYDHVCSNCRATPVVTAVKDGKVIYNTEMCGPCTFGTAAALDPEWWNSEEE